MDFQIRKIDHRITEMNEYADRYKKLFRQPEKRYYANLQFRYCFDSLQYEHKKKRHDAIITQCSIKEEDFDSWLKGIIHVPDRYKPTIAQIMHVTVEFLFPID